MRCLRSLDNQKHGCQARSDIPGQTDETSGSQNHLVANYCTYTHTHTHTHVFIVRIRANTVLTSDAGNTLQSNELL